MNLSHLRKNSIIFCDFFLKNRELRTIAYVAKNRREGPFGRKGLFFIDCIFLRVFSNEKQFSKFSKSVFLYEYKIELFIE